VFLYRGGLGLKFYICFCNFFANILLHLVGNYRGVAILSIMSAQHEFFKDRSTVTNLIEFTSYVLNCMENGVQVDGILIQGQP
jgi:hypothetical protein